MEPGIGLCLTQWLKGSPTFAFKSHWRKLCQCRPSQILHLLFPYTENCLLKTYEQWQRHRSNTKSASQMKLFSSRHIKKHLHVWKFCKQHFVMSSSCPACAKRLKSDLTWPIPSPSAHSLSQNQTVSACSLRKSIKKNLQIHFPAPPPNWTGFCNTGGQDCSY